MPNLIGTGNNQVPTNGMLGGMAYQSPDSVVIKNLELTNLAGHNSLIPSTAVDVFVYDTRKDSDGGAWRYRTQNTSWYNETLNTATRGSRRDFPAVAVIVATSNSVTIYDGDDPDMPMWSTLQNATQWTTTPTCVTALNGIIVVGTTFASAYGGTREFNFVKDFVIVRRASIAYNFVFNTIIDSRTDSYAINVGSQLNPIVNQSVNDVAMTVLPNAPIDPSTGLPVPTITVGTNSGTSVITNTGTVTNITTAIYGSGYWDSTSIFDKKYLVTTASADYTRVGIADIESVTHKFFVTSPNIPGDYLVNLGYAQHTAPLNDGFALGGIYGAGLFRESGLCLIDPNIDTPSTSMHSHITSNYNTGYQVGNTKGAWLSDTSTASVTGTELITNGTFATDVTGWTAFNSTNTWSSGTMQITRSGGSGQVTYQAFTTVAGQRYVATATINSSGSRGDLYIINGTGWGGTQLGITTGTNGQTTQLTAYFTATSTTTTLAFGIDANGTSIIVDNVSVRREEADRSVYNTGLAVYGTITKTAVATGADLVDYGGFSDTNYLEQPYNSELNFGTGSFCHMVWFKLTSSVIGADFFHSRRTTATTGTAFYLTTTNIGLQFDNTYVEKNIGSHYLNVWTFAVALRRQDGTVEIYKNGELAGTGFSSVNVSATTSSIIGNSNPLGNPFNVGSFTLLRTSATAPSANQIKKIYEEEKVLFQENAKAVLYGTSSPVTSLAYDDATRLLHVGTSSGRSDFQGLRRINNTTTAVTTAISASNGLIAEQ